MKGFWSTFPAFLSKQTYFHEGKTLAIFSNRGQSTFMGLQIVAPYENPEGENRRIPPFLRQIYSEHQYVGRQEQ